MPNHDIVVVGASLGGIENISAVLGGLPADLRASILVVMHLALESPGSLPSILQNRCNLKVKAAEDDEEISQGTVYVAVPDHHLLLIENRVRVFRGPRENRWRPAIDPLFRSAAVGFGNRVVGVLLNGFLDDGSSGLIAIKRCGGLAIVQEPGGTDSSAMVLNAIRTTPVDFVVPLREISHKVVETVGSEAGPYVEIPADLIKEVDLVSPKILSGNGKELGEPVSLTCPDCGGPLREIEDSDAVSRYRCIVGHAYSSDSLLMEQKSKYEQAVWAAIRMMEERSNFLISSAEREEGIGRSMTAVSYRDRAQEATKNAALLREYLFATT